MAATVRAQLRRLTQPFGVSTAGASAAPVLDIAELPPAGALESSGTGGAL